MCKTLPASLLTAALVAATATSALGQEKGSTSSAASDMSAIMEAIKGAVVQGAAVADAGAEDVVNADIIKGDPTQIIAVLQDMGYRAELTEDSYGDPLIRSSTAGARFSIYFYNCEEGPICRSIQFYSGFSPREKPDLSEINAWNSGQRYGKAYLDSENDPIIEYDVMMTGGMTLEAFENTLGIWDSVLGRFDDFVFN